MKKLLIAISAVAMLCCSAAYAESGSFLSTTSDLHKDCTGDSFSLMYCLGYIEGVLDAEEVVRRKKGFERRFCINEAITSEQALQIVVNFINEDPQWLRQPSSAVVLSAFVKKFPCE